MLNKFQVLTRINDIEIYFCLNTIELAQLLNVNRSTVYKWRNGTSMPEMKIYWRIEALYQAMVRFKDAKIQQPKNLLNMTISKGRSFIDLIHQNEDYHPAISYLIMHQKRQSSEELPEFNYINMSGRQLNLDFNCE